MQECDIIYYEHWVWYSWLWVEQTQRKDVYMLCTVVCSSVRVCVSVSPNMLTRVIDN